MLHILPKISRSIIKWLCTICSTLQEESNITKEKSHTVPVAFSPSSSCESTLTSCEVMTDDRLKYWRVSKGWVPFGNPHYTVSFPKYCRYIQCEKINDIQGCHKNHKKDRTQIPAHSKWVWTGPPRLGVSHSKQQLLTARQRRTKVVRRKRYGGNKLAKEVESAESTNMNESIVGVFILMDKKGLEDGTWMNKYKT